MTETFISNSLWLEVTIFFGCRDESTDKKFVFRFCFNSAGAKNLSCSSHWRYYFLFSFHKERSFPLVHQLIILCFLNSIVAPGTGFVSCPLIVLASWEFRKVSQRPAKQKHPLFPSFRISRWLSCIRNRLWCRILVFAAKTNISWCWNHTNLDWICFCCQFMFLDLCPRLSLSFYPPWSSTAKWIDSSVCVTFCLSTKSILLCFFMHLQIKNITYQTFWNSLFAARPFSTFKYRCKLSLVSCFLEKMSKCLKFHFFSSLDSFCTEVQDLVNGKSCCLRGREFIK